MRWGSMLIFFAGLLGMLFGIIFQLDTGFRMIATVSMLGGLILKRIDDIEDRL